MKLKSTKLTYDPSNGSILVYIATIAHRMYDARGVLTKEERHEDTYAFPTAQRAMSYYKRYTKEWENEKGVWVGQLDSSRKCVREELGKDAEKILIHSFLLLECVDGDSDEAIMENR